MIAPSAAQAAVRVRILDDQGKEVASATSNVRSECGRDAGCARGSSPIADPKLWDPDHPNRYVAVAEVTMFERHRSRRDLDRAAPVRLERRGSAHQRTSAKDSRDEPPSDADLYWRRRAQPFAAAGCSDFEIWVGSEYGAIFALSARSRISGRMRPHRPAGDG